MTRNFAALISLAVVFSGSFALSAQSVEAKASRNNSRRDRNYFVPPPPPYMPSLVPSVLGMMNAQTVAVDAHDEAMEKPSNTYGKHISMRKQGGTPQAVQPNSDLSYDPDVEAKIQKHIDHIDSEISNIQNEIGRVLNIEDKKGEEARPYSSDLGS